MLLLDIRFLCQGQGVTITRTCYGTTFCTTVHTYVGISNMQDKFHINYSMCATVRKYRNMNGYKSGKGSTLIGDVLCNTTCAYYIV